MPSNRKKPVDLIKAEKKAHYSKEQLAEKEKREVKVDFKNIQSPKNLTKKQAVEFMEIANKLLIIGIMTELDEEALARYIISKDIYLTYTKMLKEEIKKKKKDINIIDKIQNFQDKSFKQVRSAASDLGLTISSRCKLVMPPVEEPPKQNKFTKFGG